MESFIIQEGGKGLEKEELVRDRCVCVCVCVGGGGVDRDSGHVYA